MQDDVASDSDHTTAILLARIRAGDGVARTNLVARMEPLLRHFAHGRVPQLLRHEQDTADLLQLTWLKVLERIELIYTEEPGDFFAYLRTALINGLRESIRRVGRAPAVELGESNSFEALPAAAVDLTDWLAYEQALASLSAEHRALILMRFEFGMSFVEIAEELAETPNGVRMKIKRALARMAGVALEEPLA